MIRRSGARWFAVVCGGALVLSAYGLGGTAAVAKSSKPTVSVAKVAGVGKVLVDAKGKTLYTLTDAGTAVSCTGACATAWPPLVVKAGSKPKGGKGVTGLGTTSGDHQVTADDLPVYRFAGDTKSGQANGEGISSFGGVWHVVMAGATGNSASTPPATAKTSSSNGSYGY